MPCPAGEQYLSKPWKVIVFLGRVISRWAGEIFWLWHNKSPKTEQSACWLSYSETFLISGWACAELSPGEKEKPCHSKPN